MDNNTASPRLWQALIPVTFLMIALAINVLIFGDDATGGSNQMILILSTAVAVLVALRLGYRWADIQSGIVDSISIAMPAILILLLIGALAGTWLLSGIVPAMIYYGLQIVHPSILLFAACIACAMTSIATGSSWTTAATVGIAIMGIGKALGMPEPMIAGAIISGAYFGDKMSPLSDTTNLAAGVAGVDLFTHIRYMALTTIPSISITLLIFLIIGFTYEGNGQTGDTQMILDAIDSRFNINGWLFIVPLIVVALILKKIPAMPAIFIGMLLGAVAALVFQPALIAEIAGGENGSGQAVYIGLMQAAFGTTSISTGNSRVDELLSSGGMGGMLNTVWLILAAMMFGGVMERAGMLKCITDSLMRLVHSTATLVASTVATCGFVNLTASDQYLAIAIPGRMFPEAYKKRGLAPQNLSRSLEDAGTVTSVLVPWNTCGAYHAGILGVTTLAYLPFCFFNLISPCMSILFASLNIRIARTPPPQNGQN